jgi:four helix bundle protein
MPIENFRQLQCWQLANELRTAVAAICATQRVVKHRRFCEGFTEAAGSVCHNTAEGFARYKSRQISQFFRWALASLSEVQDYLVECRARGFIDRADFDRLWDLAEHTKATLLKFKRHHE